MTKSIVCGVGLFGWIVAALGCAEGRVNVEDEGGEAEDEAQDGGNRSIHVSSVIETYYFRRARRTRSSRIGASAIASARSNRSAPAGRNSTSNSLLATVKPTFQVNRHTSCPAIVAT